MYHVGAENTGTTMARIFPARSGLRRAQQEDLRRQRHSAPTGRGCPGAETTGPRPLLEVLDTKKLEVLCVHVVVPEVRK